MKSLGLDPTYNSGSGWIEKEDGANEFVICQLKSTDAASIRISQVDIQTLEYNACIAHKIPIFVIQFLNNQETFVLVKPIDLPGLSELIETGKCEKPDSIIIEDKEAPRSCKRKPIKTGDRSKFWEEKEVEKNKWLKKLKSKQ